jgi:DNA replication protein DnaC
MLNDLAGAEVHGQLERVFRRYCRTDFLILDDFAVLAMDPAQANLASQVISERYEYHRSTCITTNRLFKDWPKVFPEALNAQVIAERFTERSERFILDGKGYRPTKNAT